MSRNSAPRLRQSATPRRTRRATLFSIKDLPPCSGPRGAPTPPGPFSFDTLILSYYLLFVYIFALYFLQMYATVMEVNMSRLRELRRERVLSMRELEEVSGVSYNTIWRLETGKTGAQPRTIRKIAKALGVEPSELVKVEASDG